MPERRLVVIHSPGPDWELGLPLSQQVSLQGHGAHFAEWLKDGRLQMAGPFVDGAGGSLMICRPGVDEELLRRHAQADPAVESGQLQFEIRPWLALEHAPAVPVTPATPATPPTPPATQP